MVVLGGVRFSCERVTPVVSRAASAVALLSLRSFRFFELPTLADTGNCLVEDHASFRITSGPPCEHRVQDGPTSGKRAPRVRRQTSATSLAPTAAQRIQGHLAHKKQSPRRTQPTVALCLATQGFPGGGLFLRSECGTHKTVKATIWHWLSVL